MPSAGPVPSGSRSNAAEPGDVGRPATGVYPGMAEALRAGVAAPVAASTMSTAVPLFRSAPAPVRAVMTTLPAALPRAMPLASMLAWEEFDEDQLKLALSQ